MNARLKLAAFGLCGLLCLASCAALVAAAPTLISTAATLLANYEATPTPNADVVTQAQKLLAAAQAAEATYGATSSQALADTGALTAYLATSAPGNGVTPTITIPSTSAELAADAPALISASQHLLAQYEATSNPSQSVIAQANKLLAAAQSANATYGATSSQALAAAAALTAYVATSAPGDGVTPSTVPVAATSS